MEKALREEILKFTEERDWDQFHSPENLAKSIAIEAAELLECYQWNEEANLDHVKEELADVLIYCTQLAEKLQLDMEQIMWDKLKLNAKKYPVEKAKGNSKKYKEL